MTTVLISGISWQSAFPFLGIAVIADTRTSLLNTDTGKLLNATFDFTQKVRPLGRWAVGVATGDQAITRRVLDKFEAYFQRNPKVSPEDAVISRLNQLYRQGVADVVWKRNKGKRQATDYHQVVVGFIDSLGRCRLVAFGGDDYGVLGNGRGPVLMGSGIYTVEGDSTVKDVAELNDAITAHYFEDLRRQSSRRVADMLYSEAHILAVAFNETFIKVPRDPATGGAVQIITLSPNHGLEQHGLWRYILEPGQQPGEGKWEVVTPMALSAGPPGKAPTPSVAVIPTEPPHIVSLQVDANEDLTVLARIKTEKMITRHVPRNQVPPFVLEAVRQHYGPDTKGQFFVSERR